MRSNRSSFFCAVQPDPPVDLNWTLLNVSSTGSYFDVLLNWTPPQSADVKMGWMTLQYEVQYRDSSTDKWTVVGISSFKVSHSFILRVVVVLNKLASKNFFSFFFLIPTAGPCEIDGLLAVRTSNKQHL